MKNSVKKLLSLLAAASLLSSILASCESTGEPKETAGSGTETKTQEEEAPAFDYDPARTLFVSVTGDDAAAGTFDAPLATLAGAKAAVRKLLETAPGTVTVYFRGGDYYVNETVAFDAGDSGKSKDEPVIYKAYNGETVCINGGAHVDPSKITSASDTWVADLMPNEDQAKSLMAVDLTEYGRLPGFAAKYGTEFWTGFGELPFGRDEKFLRSPEVFLGDTALMRARWPEEGTLIRFPLEFTENDDADEYDGKNKSKNVTLSDEILARAEGWSERSRETPYFMGMLYTTYHYEMFKIYDFNMEGKFMKLRSGKNDWMCTTGGGYFLNIPEEMDVPGESFVDENEGIMYFIPTEDFDPENVYYSINDSNLVSFENTKHIVFEEIDFKYSRKTAITGTGIEDLTLKNCDVLHTSECALVLDGTDILLSGCEIGDTNSNCIEVTGGDDKTLTSGGFVAENCYIHDCGRNKSDWGFVTLISSYSTGMVLRNCEFSGNFASAIAPHANNMLVEYCEFHDLMQYAGDYGVFYWNEVANNFGYVIRYNYFHDIGNSYGFGHHVIYEDGIGMGAEIYGNLFANIRQNNEDDHDGVIKLGKAQFNRIYNNVFVDDHICVWNAITAEPALDWTNKALTGHGESKLSYIEELEAMGYDSEIWHKAYDGRIFGDIYKYVTPELVEFAKSERGSKETSKYVREHPECVPEGENFLENNVAVGYDHLTMENDPMFVDDALNNYMDKEGSDTSIFKDYAGGDYTLTAEGLAKVREAIPDFEELPLDKMGRYKNDN